MADTPTPVAGEFLVNTVTADFQVQPTIAALADGGYVVVWASGIAAQYDIKGQRYDAVGNPVEGEFLINTFTSGLQTQPAVAALPDGGFVVVWQSTGQEPGAAIYGQRFNADSSKEGAEFHIDAEPPPVNTNNGQTNPAVTVLADGRFVVTWTAAQQDGAPLSPGIFGRIYDVSDPSTPVAVDGEFHINTTTAGTQQYSSVTALSDGGFVVTWASGATVGDTEIFAHRYDASGAPVGDEVQVNTETLSQQTFSSTAALAGGGYVVTWASVDAGDFNFDISGQLFDASGAKVGGEFQVNPVVAGRELFPSVTALADGGFVVTWTANLDNPGSGDFGVYGQRFDATGAKAGDEFLVNQTTVGHQTYEEGGGDYTIVQLASGELVAVWEATEPSGYYDVYARHFTLPGTNRAPVATDDAFSLTEDGDANPATGNLGGVLGDLRFKDEAGNVVGLNDLGPGPVLISVCPTWCLPCRGFAEDSAAISQGLAALGVSSLEIIIDNADPRDGLAATATDVAQWIADTGSVFRTWHVDGSVGTAAALQAALGIAAFPHYVLLDPSTGAVLGEFSGYAGEPQPFLQQVAAGLATEPREFLALKSFITGNVLADNGAGLDLDPDGNPLTVTAVDGSPLNVGVPTVLASGALLTLNANGDFTYAPNGAFDALNEGESATDSFSYTVSDGLGGGDTATVTLTIAGRAEHSPPVAVDDVIQVRRDATEVLFADPLLNDSDANGDALSIRRLFVTDENETLLAEFAPGESVVLPSGSQIVVLDDPDTDPQYFFIPSPAYAGLQRGEQAVETVFYEATSADGSDVGRITFVVDGFSPASAVNDAFAMSEDDVTLIAPAGALLANDQPALPGDALSVVGFLGLGANAGTPFTFDGDGSTLTVFADGSFSFTPGPFYQALDAGETLDFTFTYTMTDGFATADAVATIAVTGADDVSDPPVAATDLFIVSGNDPVNADGQLLATVNSPLANDSDPNGDLIRLLAVTDPVSGVSDPRGAFSDDGFAVFLNDDGEWRAGLFDSGAVFARYRPLGAGETDSHIFTYEIEDQFGKPAVGQIEVRLVGVNDAPIVANPIADQDATANSSFTFALPADTFVDPDANDVLALTATMANGNPLPSWLTFDPGARTFSGTPLNGAAGAISVRVTATDGALVSVFDDFALTVVPGNAAPVANPETYTIHHGQFLGVLAPVGLLVNDTDADGDTLTAVLDSPPPIGSFPLGGIGVDGSFAYFAPVDFVGTTQFSYHVTDGISDSNVVTVTIEVTNEVPVASPETYRVAHGQFLGVFAPTGLLVNDTDADGDTLTAVLNSPPPIGSFPLGGIGMDGSFAYFAPVDFVGTTQFSYHVTDGASDSNIVTVNIEVTNEVPVADNDTYSVNEDNTLTTTVVGVLTNDSDADGDALSAILATGPANGMLTLNANGSLTYTPNANFNGTDSFTYRANDGFAESNVATVTLNVAPVNDRPVANPDIGTAGEIELKRFDVLANDTDVDANDSKVLTTILDVDVTSRNTTVNSIIAAGAFSIVGGQIQYNPGLLFDPLKAGETATVTILYGMRDAAGLGSTSTLTLTIVGAELPVAGTDGRNHMSGTAASETFDGGGGADNILAGAGDDIIVGGTGSDLVDAGPGNDTVIATRRDGIDFYFGDSGSDTYDLSRTSADAVVSLALGGTGLQSAISRDIGVDVLEEFENVVGGSGDDTIDGNELANILRGGAGQDLIRGREGDDQLFGDAGRDQIIGGLGDDRMSGGAGGDLFEFRRGQSQASDVDRITDFVVGEDRLLLRGLSIVRDGEGDSNDDGVIDTFLSLSDGSIIELLGVSDVRDWQELL